MERSTPDRILTTHTGSLARATELRELLAARESGQPYNRERFEALVSAEVSRLVAEQVAAGIDIINDGEQGKSSFVTYRLQRLSGFELVDASEWPANTAGGLVEADDFPEFFADLWQWNRAGGDNPAPGQVLACTGPVGWADFSEVERDVANLTAATAKVPAVEVFMTSISPATYAPPNLHYSSEDAYLDALADAMGREYRAIVDAGFILQIDAPDLTTLFRMARISEADHHEAHARRVAAINRAVAGLPADRLRVHACWGADEAPHHRDIPLRNLVHSLLQLRPQGLAVPGANGRHSHEWRVWEEVALPDDKVLIPGVIDSTTNIVEHPDAVAERISRYAGVVGPERLIAGVDCGFGTVAQVGEVDARVAMAKLRSLAEGAAIASKHKQFDGRRGA
jgi:5-methyltetrahydropteroyltriglutamate--homocysteine methyltransferase